MSRENSAHDPEISTSAIFYQKNRLVADALIEAVNELREYWPLTVRQCFYQMVARLVMPNSLKSYAKVSRVLVSLRANNLLPWHCIEDRTRRTTIKRGNSNVIEWLEKELERFANPSYYGRCFVQNQDVYVEVSTEKDALSSIMENALWGYCTRLNIVRGNSSATMLEVMSRRFDDAIMKGKKPILIHFGDLDPTGVSIPKTFKRILAERHGVDVEVIRAALNPDHVEKYNLLNDPEAIKKADSNYNAFVKEFGKDQPAVELDALHPDELINILRESLESVYDMDEFDEQREREKQDRKIIQNLRTITQDFLLRSFPDLFCSGGSAYGHE